MHNEDRDNHDKTKLACLQNGSRRHIFPQYKSNLWVVIIHSCTCSPGKKSLVVWGINSRNALSMEQTKYLLQSYLNDGLPGSMSLLN